MKLSETVSKRNRSFNTLHTCCTRPAKVTKQNSPHLQQVRLCQMLCQMEAVFGLVARGGDEDG